MRRKVALSAALTETLSHVELSVAGVAALPTRRAARRRERAPPLGPSQVSMIARIDSPPAMASAGTRRSKVARWASWWRARAIK